MSFEVRWLKPSLMAYFMANKNVLVKELRAGSWELFEGASMSREYDNLEAVAEDTYRLSKKKGNGSNDAPTADETGLEISRRATKMHRAIQRERFFIDPEGCFIVLPIS